MFFGYNFHCFLNISNIHMTNKYFVINKSNFFLIKFCHSLFNGYLIIFQPGIGYVTNIVVKYMRNLNKKNLNKNSISAKRKVNVIHVDGLFYVLICIIILPHKYSHSINIKINMTIPT